MARNVFFESLALNDGNPFFVNDYDPDGSADKTLRLVPIARQNGGILVYEEYNSLVVTVSGHISCESELLLDAAIDTLKSTLRSAGTLRVQYGSSYRLLDCIATKVSVPRGREHISFAPYTIQFESESPFWREEGLDYHIFNENITTADDTFNVSIASTMDAEMVFTLEITEITPDNSDVQISIGNSSTNQFITVTETFHDADVLVIDCKQKQAFLNGSLIKARGLFPVWEPGAGVVEYSDDASTSRDITISSANERRFL